MTNTKLTKLIIPQVALRDTLLPKLISGEIRMKDAERFLKQKDWNV